MRVFDYLTDNESFILKSSNTRILESSKGHYGAFAGTTLFIISSLEIGTILPEGLPLR